MAYEKSKMKKTPKQTGRRAARNYGTWSAGFPVQAMMDVDGHEESRYFRNLKEARAYVVRKEGIRWADVQKWDQDARSYVGKRQLYSANKKSWNMDAPIAEGEDWRSY